MVVSLRRPLTLAECQQIREWRNAPDVTPMLRTGHKTAAEQEWFYRHVVCNPESEHRYYAIEATRLGYHVVDWEREPTRTQTFVGVGGLTYINPDRHETEISLVLGPEFRGHGFGAAAVDALIEEAARLKLNVIGECYPTGNLGFWTEMIRRRPALMKWKWTL